MRKARLVTAPESHTRSTLRVLNGRVTSTVHWDREGLAAKDPEALAAVEEAERIYNAARARGAQAFRVAPGQVAQRLREFDPSATEIVVIPQMVGG